MKQEIRYGKAEVKVERTYPPPPHGDIGLVLRRD